MMPDTLYQELQSCGFWNDHSSELEEIDHFKTTETDKPIRVEKINVATQYSPEEDIIEKEFIMSRNDSYEHSCNHRNCFSRTEMCKALTERNHYKELLMQVEDAVRVLKLVQSERCKNTKEPGKYGSIRKFFSKFLDLPRKRDSWLHSNQTGRFRGFGDEPVKYEKRKIHRKSFLFQRYKCYEDEEHSLCTETSFERKEKYVQVTKSDETHRHVTKWSTPTKWIQRKTSNKQNKIEDYTKQTDSQPRHKYYHLSYDPTLEIWCATKANLCIESIKNQSTFLFDVMETLYPITSIDSLLWICGGDSLGSKVMVIDIHSFDQPLEMFRICSSRITCIVSVPGKKICINSCYDESITEEFNASENSLALSECNDKQLPPTMWIGAEDGSIYVYETVAESRKYSQFVRLDSSVLCILYASNRIFAGTGDGKLAIFSHDNQWDVRNPHIELVNCARQPISCLICVQDELWCSCFTDIFIINSNNYIIEDIVETRHYRKKHIHQFASVDNGVWISFLLESNLQLYHAKTHQLLQDVDLKPVICKALENFTISTSLIHITSLLTTSTHIWIGIGNGAIISIPIMQTDLYYKNTPYCLVSSASLKYFGHRNDVKFLIAFPDTTSIDVTTEEIKNCSLIVSCGEGFVNFSTSNLNDISSITNNYNNYIVVWHP